MITSSHLAKGAACALFVAAGLTPFIAHAYNDEIISTTDDSVARIDRADGAVVYVFTSTAGEITVTPNSTLNLVEYLVVGGGGSGGNTIGGGGGGGGVVASPDGFSAIVDSSIAISVGAGAPSTSIANSNWKCGSNGAASTLSIPGSSDIVAYGGGGGGGWNDFHAVPFSDAAPYANGGGGSSTNGKGGTGLSYSGGNSYVISGNDRAPGGGAGAAGNGEAGKSTGVAGNGGPGVLSSITGEELDYGAGGGGGGGNNITSASAGGPSGGDGGARNANKPGNSGLDGRGGGGGGGGYNPATTGGKGGNGTVILAVRPTSITVANTFCGYSKATVSTTVKVMALPQMDEGDSYLVTQESDVANLPSTGWTAYDPDAALPNYTFAPGTTFGEVTIYCHVRRAAGGAIETESTSITYVEASSGNAPTAKAKPTAVPVDVSGAGLALDAALIDDGSSDDTYGIYCMGVSPAVITGDADVTLHVTNKLGLASTATARVSATKYAGFDGSLKIWLDANDFAKYPTDTKVSGWTDKASGVAFSQATANNKPVVLNAGLNGKTVLKFTRPAANQAQFLQASGSDVIYTLFNSTNTAFAVARATSGGGDNNTQKTTYIFSRPGNHSGMTFEGYPNATTATATRWVGQGTTTKAAMVVSTPYTQGEWITLSRVIRGNETAAPVEIDVSVNNEPAASASNTAWSLYTHGTTNGKIMRIGCANNNSNYSGGLSGEIAEILVYDRELTAEEQAVVSQILNEKWGFLKLSVENILTGSKLYTATNEVVVSAAEMYGDTVEYQISSVSSAEYLDPDSWVPVDTPVPETFVFPAETPEGEVAISLWMRNALGDVKSTSASMTFTRTPPAVLVNDVELDIDSVAGYSLDVDKIDAGSTDETGIFSRRIEPSVVYGATNVVLTIMNNAGVVACATSHVSVANALDLHVETNGSDEFGDGTAANPFATITHALSVANNSPSASQRTVYVGDGTFSAESGEIFPLVVSNNVSIVGAGMGETIIDAEYANYIVNLANAPTPGLVSGLSLRRGLTRAINSAAWAGTIENVEISDVQSANAVIRYAGGSTARNFVLSGLCVTNISSTAQRLLELVGTGTLTITNSLFSDFSTTAGSGQSQGHIQVQGGWPCTLVDTVFENISIKGAGNREGGFLTLIQPSPSKHTIDRCIFRNFTYTGKPEQVICFNRVTTPTVRNSLFVNISMPSTDGLSCCIGGFRSNLNVRNCTFHDCQCNVFRPPEETGNYFTRVYNSIVSECGKLCNLDQAHLYLNNVDIFDTPLGIGYSEANSSGVSDFEPYFKNADAGNFSLKPMSPLIDIGNNSYVEAEVQADLALGARVADGDGDGNATVDLGAYEYYVNPNAARFVTSMPSYGVFAGRSTTIPVWIEPAQARGPVTANVTCPTNTTGEATLFFPTGLETNYVTVTAWETLDVVSGTILELEVSDSAEAIDSASIGVLVNDRIVYVPDYAARRFLHANESVPFTPIFTDPLLVAPETIEISASAQSGDVGSLVWNGTEIAAGDAAANGSLVLTGDSTPGASAITLSLPDGWKFAESNERTLDFELISFASPLHVSPDGDDADGIGTVESPLRTMTYAVQQLRAGEGLHLLPGVYGPTDGEVFPVTVPPGIAIIGERGPLGTDEDTSIVDPDKTGWAFILGTLGKDPGSVAGGELRSLVVRNTAGSAISSRYWGGTIADCLFTAMATGSLGGNTEVGGGSAIAYFTDIRNGLVLDGVEMCCVTTSAQRVLHVPSGTGAVTIKNSHFHDLKSTSACSGTGMFEIRNTGGFTLQDSLVENIVAKGANGESQGVFHTMNIQANYLRDTFRDIDITGSSTLYVLISINRCDTPLIANCLFHDITSAGGYAITGGFRNHCYIRNCTIDSVPTVSQHNGWGTTYIYNSTISNSKINLSSAAGTPGAQNSMSMVLCNVNLYDTTEGTGYYTNSSANVTEYLPGFKNPAERDYHIRSSSQLRDAGNNSYVVTAMGDTDLDGSDRIFRADKGGIVDLGCYENSTFGGTIFLLK